MSTVVDQQQPAPVEVPTTIEVPITTEVPTTIEVPTTTVAPTTTEGIIAPTAEPTQNGDSKAEEKKQNGKAKKEPEAPKDPKDDFDGWLQGLNNKAVHKADYLLLKGIVNKAYAEGAENKPALPESGYLTKREFMRYFQDGTLLAQFANAIKPGSVESIKEGEEAKTEENQKANVDAFIAVAKEFLSEEQLFTFEDLKKGKEEYQKVFNALFHLVFKTEHPEFDQFVKEVGDVEPEKLYNKLVDKFTSFAIYVSTKVRKPFTRSNSQIEQPTEQPAEQNGTNGVHINGTTETTHEENGVSNGTKIEEKKEELPAVAAN